ncbi:MAG: hypothetical protein ACFFC7_17140 [Candidatus Hermodarchaeota archaeon]
MDKHSDERRKIYSIEPAFDVKGIETDDVDTELERVAQINKASKKPESFIVEDIESEFFPTEFSKMTSRERKRLQEL